MASFKAPEWVGYPSRGNEQAHLEAVKCGSVIATIPIGKRSTYVIGRNKDLCDISVLHPSISRQHAVILHHKDEPKVFLMDLGSAQGTFVNHKQLQPHSPTELRNDDMVQFAQSARAYHVRQVSTVKELGSNACIATVSEECTDSGNKEKAQLDREEREKEIAKFTEEMLHVTGESKDNVDVQVFEEKKEEIPVQNLDPQSDASSEDEEADIEDDVHMRYNLPVSHQVHLKSHTKSITCIAVDPRGGRIATGSMDYHVKLWDFAGMARNVHPFREIEVDEGHPIVALSYSPSGDRLLTVTGSSQPKVISREGLEEIQFVKGDMYVVDMANTKGHTHAVTCGKWHPHIRDEMITSSLDGTVRIWKLDGVKALDMLVNNKVLKPKGKNGKRCGITSCTYNKEGNLIAGTTLDGQIQWFDLRKAYAGPCIHYKTAHIQGTADLGISSVCPSPDGRIFASRSCADETVKIWDYRKNAQPLKVFTDINGLLGSANVVFNPSGTCVAVGCNVPKGKQLHGQLRFYDVHTTEIYAPIAGIDMSQDESAICVEWHHTLNQIFVGTSANTCRVCYDPNRSVKGVLLTATTKLKAKYAEFGARIDGVGKIYNPHALPMYREEIYQRERFHKKRNDPLQTRAPEKPLTGPGVGGRISGSTTFTQYFMRDHIKRTFREEDPREAILEYAKKAKEDPQFLGAAYANSAGTIDKRYQLAKETLEEEELKMEEEEKRLLQV